jgi:chaperone required for assembly of F1-ATPase
MKRFWRKAAVAALDGHYAVMLDGKPMRLPEGPALRLESETLANAIAEEWDRAGAAPGGAVSLDDLPLTRLAGTAQARVAANQPATAAALAAYAETDLLCYRAEHPDALVAQQHAAWQPWLDWAAGRYQARLVVATGILPVAQPEPALTALRRPVEACDAFELTGLGIIVPALGSLVLSLAILDGAITAEDAYEVSVLDDLFQESLWGIDRDALARRRLARRDVVQAAHFIALSRP